MTNPWLQIPAADYEGHMSSPEIAQQQFLARTFQESLGKYESGSIAMLGCTTGNGLEHIDPAVTKKVTAVDINPEYLEILRRRHARLVAGLEVVEADLETCALESSAYSLVFAGLIFEYVQPQILLPKIAGWLRDGGVMVAVLQLPAKNHTKVSQSRFESLKALAPIMQLVPPRQFKSIANDAGLMEAESKTVHLESGKPFYIGTYAKR
ncbi:MAG: class I SAM-dependent methyltransferase [Chloroflexi bacterium]|nr:class I SAM-dependent methyltransferase [Chloroflexota bacterium]